MLGDESSRLVGRDEQVNGSLEEALSKYQEALVYALCYNRYLLDEMVEKIIKKAAEMAEKGRREAARGLIEQLIEFWQTATLEGKPLVEAEREGREREKGDGRSQRMVLEQLKEAVEGLREAG